MRLKEGAPPVLLHDVVAGLRSELGNYLDARRTGRGRGTCGEARSIARASVVAEAHDLGHKVTTIQSVVGLAVEDRDPRLPAGSVDLDESRNDPLSVDGGLAIGIIRVQVDIERIEEQHRGLAWDDGEICHRNPPPVSSASSIGSCATGSLTARQRTAGRAAGRPGS